MAWNWLRLGKKKKGTEGWLQNCWKIHKKCLNFKNFTRWFFEKNNFYVSTVEGNNDIL